jgi:hypothetical protein
MQSWPGRGSGTRPSRRKRTRRGVSRPNLSATSPERTHTNQCRTPACLHRRVGCAQQGAAPPNPPYLSGGALLRGRATGHARKCPTTSRLVSEAWRFAPPPPSRPVVAGAPNAAIAHPPGKAAGTPNARAGLATPRLESTAASPPPGGATGARRGCTCAARKVRGPPARYAGVAACAACAAARAPLAPHPDTFPQPGAPLRPATREKTWRSSVAPRACRPLFNNSAPHV